MMQQLIINTLIAGCIYSLVALGFAAIFQTSRFIHFAHGVIFTAGAYFTFFFKVWLGCSLWVAALTGILVAALMGCLMERYIYRFMRKNESNKLVLLLSSLGIYILMQNIISMIFGDQTQSFRDGIVREGIDIAGARITPIQIITICVSVILAIALSVFLKKTKTGCAMRAVANDSELANVSGINSNCTILWAFAIGSGLAGLAGILVALDVNMTPTMGMNALMMGVVTVIIGGVNSVTGIALGALLLATAQNIGAWYIGSQWQEAIAFVILVIFLLLRPQGFFGRKIRSASV